MDTGSSLLWVNCEPCGYNVPGPIFHPKESSSYRIEDCNQYSEVCEKTGAVKITCDDEDAWIVGCGYIVLYGKDQSYTSKGHLAIEEFKFGRSREVLRNILFGCAESTSMYVNGVLGLGGNHLSLLAQRRSSKFSYCIGNISDKSYTYNTLVIGENVELLGPQTPLIIENQYYINLMRITIGRKTLDINPQTFKRKSDYTGGMIVDTGSTLSFIPEVALEKFESEVIYVIGIRLDRTHSIYYEGKYERLCYNGVMTRDLIGFPIVQLQFQGNAVMKLVADNIFQQVNDENFCLAILPSEMIFGASISILGNLMQQYLYFAYDLKAKKVAFQGMSCNTVDDYIHDEL